MNPPVGVAAYMIKRREQKTRGLSDVLAVIVTKICCRGPIKMKMIELQVSWLEGNSG